MKYERENNPTPSGRIEEMVVQELPDEVLVYDLRHHKAHCLNRTAAFVWNRCDGRSTPGEIAEMMEKEWQSPVSVDAVWFTLNKLSKADLLHERIVLPQSKSGMSRRTAIRRLGIGALMIPAVISIVAPTAMAGSSIPPICQTCVKKINGVGACPNVCGDICGTCFGNSGCGAGQEIACEKCSTCLATAPTMSWVTPGTLNCPPTGC